MVILFVHLPDDTAQCFFVRSVHSSFGYWWPSVFCCMFGIYLCDVYLIYKRSRTLSSYLSAKRYYQYPHGLINMFTRPTLGRTYETDLLKPCFLFIIKLVVFLAQKNVSICRISLRLSKGKDRWFMEDSKEMTNNFPFLFCSMSIKYVCPAFPCFIG